MSQKIIQFDVKERFDCAPAELFDALIDLKHAGAWMPGFVSMDQLTPGDFGLGTVFRETRRFMGQVTVEQFEVVHFDPPKSLGLLADGTKRTSGRGEYRFRYELSRCPGGTEMRLLVAALGIGFLAGAPLAALRPDVQADPRQRPRRAAGLPPSFAAKGLSGPSTMGVSPLPMAPLPPRFATFHASVALEHGAELNFRRHIARGSRLPPRRPEATPPRSMSARWTPRTMNRCGSQERTMNTVIHIKLTI